MKPTGQPPPLLRLPASAIEELEELERWEISLEMEELLQWVNAAVACFAPDWDKASGRVSAEFSPRTFRHYQTMGCVDPPERAGRKVYYGFRHYLQALLIRRLLHERVPSDRILSIMKGRTNAEYKQLLLAGIEIIPQVTMGIPEADALRQETWTRIALAPGIEIHLQEHLRRPDEAQLATWVRDFEVALRRHF